MWRHLVRSLTPQCNSLRLGSLNHQQTTNRAALSTPSSSLESQSIIGADVLEYFQPSAPTFSTEVASQTTDGTGGRKDILDITQKLSWADNDCSVKDLHINLRNILNALDETRHEVHAIRNEQRMLYLQRKVIQEQLRVRTPLLKDAVPLPHTVETVESDFTSKNYPWSSDLVNHLEKVFRLESFRTVQLQAINALLQGNDVIMIMSTGGGKSLCYQLPALISKGVTLVVTPLISLMEDQVMELKACGVKAHCLHSEMPYDVVTDIYQSLESPESNIKLLYITPERFARSKQFITQLQKCYKMGTLAHIAIDEVHCISQWGNDFRPDYNALGKLKEMFPKTPIIGLTATSPQRVTEDTIDTLRLKKPLLFKTPLNRKNLFYQVRKKGKTHQQTMKDIIGIIKNNFSGQAGIIYCLSRRNCSDVCRALEEHGIKSAVYHAKLTPNEKRNVHSQWKNNEVQVVCATIAFGMGINKTDVRFVIHHTISKSVENYFQESGRAGRDGLPALCLMYYSFNDIFRQLSLVCKEKRGVDNLKRMIDYCEGSKSCRREILSQHFEEEFDPSKDCGSGCDICSGIITTESIDVNEACRSILLYVLKNRFKDKRITFLQLVKAFKDNTDGLLDQDIHDKLCNRNNYLERLLVFMVKKDMLRFEFQGVGSQRTHTYIAPGNQSVTTACLASKELDNPDQDNLTLLCCKESNSSRHYEDVYKEIFN